MLLTEVGLISHFIAAIAFLALAIAALWRRQGLFNWLFAGAAALTGLWAMVFVLAVMFNLGWALWLSPAQTLKVAGWIAVLLALLKPSWENAARGRVAFAVGSTVGFVVALQLVLELTGTASEVLVGDRSLAAQLFLVSRIAVAVTGLVLAHNLYVNSEPGSRGGLRLLALGLGALFLYDLNYYTLAFLLPEPSTDLFNIRGAVDTLIVPLLLFATRENWLAQARPSRHVVFQTVAFSGIGFYLIAMSLLAYGLRLVGGSWGTLFQVTFLSGTIILGAVVLLSPRVRAWLRVQIAKNFFRYKYDYRTEWLRFIATVSGPGHAGQLPARVIQAVAQVFDSPGGLLLAPEDDQLQLYAQWELRRSEPQPVGMAEPWVQDMAATGRVVDLDAVRAEGGTDLPAWLREDRRLWLVLPLVHLDNLAGALVLERSLVDRPLNWEDFDLLRTLGRQAASYIAESASQQQLSEAQRFEEFNRRFAFILHDIKNLVSQLSLVARNAERHADNPEFRADMVATLQSSVGKMNGLLGWLSQRGTGAADTSAPVALDTLLRQIVKARQRQHPALTLDIDAASRAGGLVVTGDAARIEQLFVHLIQNAMDASAPDAPIAVTAAAGVRDASITIADQGRGMSARFVRHELFQPFRSTKAGGFGIGAYEAREIARAHGGRLDVVSREGEGTIFTVSLPLAQPGIAGITDSQPGIAGIADSQPGIAGMTTPSPASPG